MLSGSKTKRIVLTFVPETWTVEYRQWGRWFRATLSREQPHVAAALYLARSAVCCQREDALKSYTFIIYVE